MSWLAERKNRQGKTSAWLYRYKDKYGIEHQRSTKEKDKKAALRIKKHWDAYILLNGCLPEEKEEIDRTSEEYEIENQIERFLLHKSAEIRESTIERYRTHFKAVKSFLNKKRVYFFEQLNTSLMNDYKFERLKSGTSYKTVFEDLAVFRALIKSLVEEEIIERDPVKKWPEIQKKIPKHPETLGPYSDEEVIQILSYAKENMPYFYPVAMVAFYAGLRAGEIRDLKVKDIDFNTGILTVFNRKSIRDAGTAYRKILMHPDLIAVLKQKCKLCLPEALVFASEQNRWRDWAASDMAKICKELNIQYRRFHGCRHTFATKLANSGIGLPKVQAALGHTNLATTQRYVKSNMLDKNDLDKISFG
ncbi:MAG: site-specific integrase [Lachnospiraceae bacterium]|nr:site-specific integrase [Lachnospiraceae bacterium]